MAKLEAADGCQIRFGGAADPLLDGSAFPKVVGREDPPLRARTARSKFD